MSLVDGAVYARRKSEIIGIDDEAPHKFSVARENNGGASKIG